MMQLGGDHRFLAETSNQHRIVADQLGQDYLDSKRRFEQDMTRLENNAHASMPQTPVQLVATIEDSIAFDRQLQSLAIGRAVIKVVGKTIFTGRAFFHLFRY